MFKLTIKTDNAAFEDGSPDELARILRNLANRIEMYSAGNDCDGRISDANGNTVGKWSLTGQED